MGRKPTPKGISKLDYGFARRPRWLAMHLLAVLGLAIMIAAGFWQLSRLYDKQARNRLLDSRAREAPVPVASLLGPTDGAEAVAPVAYRLVTATGVYAPADEVFVRNRSLDGAPGSWVLTPLVQPDGSAVIVNRGWVPATSTTPVLPEGAAAPAGTVSVTGLLLPSQRRGSIGPTDPAEGKLPTLARADLERLQRQVEVDLFPGYVQVLPDPTAGAASVNLPRPIPAPERTEGPHRGYAGQWFLFAVIWSGGYPMLVRRAAQRRAAELADTGNGDGEGAQTPVGVARR